MLKNYLTIAWRNLKQNKGYAFLNIAGLAIGFAACLIIGLYLRHELSYDEFHENAERIYRLNMKYGDLGASGLVPAEGARAIAQQFPEIANYARLYRSDVIITSGQEPVAEEDFYYTDPSFFDIFSFPLKQGNPETALAEPNTVVLTEEATIRYFSGENAVGQTLTLRNGTVLQITGVLKNIPSNSHLQFDFLASFSTLPAPSGFDLQSHTYFLLTKAATAKQLKAKLDRNYATQTKEGSENTFNRLGFMVKDLEFGLQPITKIHLKPFFGGMIQPVNRAQTLYIFGCIALFVLLLAGVNYVNLSTARAAQRAKEVGIRKAVGAGRGQLARQFLGEALLTALAAGILSLFLARLLLPGFNALMNLELSFTYFANLQLLTVVIGALLLTGFLAGAYPALVLSRFKSGDAVKGNSHERSGAINLRRGLVVCQFAISIIIVTATLVAQSQLRYINNKPLGFATEAIVSIPLTKDVKDRAETFKTEIMRVPGVESASLAHGTPIAYLRSDITYNGQKIPFKSLHADADYIETMQMKLIAGKGFPEYAAEDSTVQIVVNETAARIFELKNKVGELLTVDFAQGEERLVGIVSDFHSASLHEQIGPVVIYSRPYFNNSLVLRLGRSQISSTLSALQNKWQQFTADAPFIYHFLDESLRQLYEDEARLAGLTTVFALLAILIACFGLFGLAAFAAERRTKEIGIRKVLGATVANIVGLLSKDFLKLILIGFIIAIPIAWYAMNQWLQDFAYRIEIGPGIFLLAGALAVLIALATVSWQSIRAALANPTDSLRSE